MLLCIHDVVRLCYKMWSWEDSLKGVEGARLWAQSREYTSVILKDTARRIMQKIHAVEKIECFEVLIEIRQASNVHLLQETSNLRSQLCLNLCLV